MTDELHGDYDGQSILTPNAVEEWSGVKNCSGGNREAWSQVWHIEQGRDSLED